MRALKLHTVEDYNMRSFKVGIDDSNEFGIDQNFCIFATDIVEAAIKSFELLNTVQEALRKVSSEDDTFHLNPESLRISYISDEGFLTGGEVTPNNSWTEEFADQMVLRIKKYLGPPCE